MHLLWLVLFWLMQALAQVIFKFGTTAPDRWLWCFLGGNVFGASSIWLLMLLYRSMNPNVALGLGTAGGFLCAQASLALLFRVNVMPLQYAGALAVALGMALFSIGAKA